MPCEFCAKPGPRYDLMCDECVMRKIMAAPDRNARRQILVAVRMRRGRAAEQRLRERAQTEWAGRKARGPAPREEVPSPSEIPAAPETRAPMGPGTDDQVNSVP
jgi:hypothetical protein